MPELPEVETTRRGLLKAAKDQTITKVLVRRSDLRWPIPARFIQAVEGATITTIRRRAKYLLIDLDNGKTMLVHLGMSGSMVVSAAKMLVFRTHDHVVFFLGNGQHIVFHDPRRFGMMDVLDAGDEKTHALLYNLGPEPLSKGFTPTYLLAQLARRKIAIKPALMDQKLVVGVGNIYASESLFLAKINPYIQSDSIKSVPQAEALIAAIRTTLNAAIKSGGSTLRNYVGAGNERGYFQHRFLVYGRDAKPCFTCATIIETSVQAGRATYWCPACQPICATRQKR